MTPELQSFNYFGEDFQQIVVLSYRQYHICFMLHDWLFYCWERGKFLNDHGKDHQAQAQTPSLPE
jgi:hypothetical protein